MGMRAGRDFLDGIRYNTKSSEEIRAALTRRIEEVTSFVQRREQRIAKLRADYNINAEQLVQLIMRFERKGSEGFVNYNHQPGEQTIPVGVIKNIISEQEMIENEQQQLKKMNLIQRNLRDTELYHTEDTGETRERRCIHYLDDADLEYLGF